MFKTDADVNTGAQNWAKALTPEAPDPTMQEYARVEILTCAEMLGSRSGEWATNSPLEAFEQWRLAVIEYLNAEEALKDKPSTDEPGVRCALLKTAALFKTAEFDGEALRLQAFEEFRLAIVEYLGPQGA